MAKGKLISLEESRGKGRKLSAAMTSDLEAELEKRRFGLRFPLECFNKKIRPWLEALVNEYNLPDSYVGLGLLTAYSTAVGTGYHIDTGKLGNIYFPIWAACEGNSSSGKSLTSKLIFRPLRNIQKEWNAERKLLTPDELKDKPIRAIVYTDSHIATLINQILPHNQKGVMQDPDELRNWINGMDKMVRSGKDGTDEGFWMACWSCEAYMKFLSGNRFFNLDKPFLNVFGGIQPSIIYQLFQNHRDLSGFVFRLLFALPYKNKTRIAMPDIRFEMPDEWEQLHSKCLTSLYKGIVVYDAAEESRAMTFEKSGWEYYISWRNGLGTQINLIEDEYEHGIKAGIFGKIVNYAMRFAGLLHLADKAYDGAPFMLTGETIELDTVKRAIVLAEYFYEAAVNVSSRVVEDHIAPVRMLPWIGYVKAGLSIQDMGDIEYPPSLTPEARRKRAARTLKKYLTTHPGSFNL